MPPTIHRQAALATSSRIIVQQVLDIPAQTTLPLVTSMLPCALIWIGAPTGTDGQAAMNVGNLYLGSKPDASNIAAGQPLMPANHEGWLLPVADAGAVYVSNPGDQTQRINIQILA
ncbi:MAG: hypothetical protein JJU36_06435 [Phycisphaeraceae bacterium]|nr:hypothetical protein [Phycisphaeraceae bacterium]